ncbi:MAG: hypothetical protein J1E95_02940 [Muribaculaceae bacterium]|nr:hypothetical protein [Muribaculaceae bacterium]
MTQVEILIDLNNSKLNERDREILRQALEARKEADIFIREDKYVEAMERTVVALRKLKEFKEYGNPEFKTLFIALLFDLAEIHFCLKNYKQSEKEVDVLFKVLDNLVKVDEDRYASYHILAMELSTRILRSRKKALDLLVKQQITNGSLFEKVNSGVVAATDKLVDSLSTTAQLLAATGDINESLKFYAEAIKYSKKRTGRVTLKEVKMTVEMAEVMMRLKSLRPRAKRLLDAILPHAVALKADNLHQDIIALLDVIDSNNESDSTWRVFLHKITSAAKSKLKKKQNTQNVDTVEH